MTQKQVDLQKFLEEAQKDYLDSLETMQGFRMSTAHIPNPLQKTMESLEKELNQDIYSSDNAIDNTIAKKEKKQLLNKYSSTKVNIFIKCFLQ